MRRGLAGDVDAVPFRLPYELDALPAGDVTNVIRRAGLLRKLKVALDRTPFAFPADPRVTVRAGVVSLVDTAASQKRPVLTVADGYLTRVLIRSIASRMTSRD